MKSLEIISVSFDVTHELLIRCLQSSAPREILKYNDTVKRKVV
jgi:hypothetical protein